jgi:hypothetical protein
MKKSNLTDALTKAGLFAVVGVALLAAGCQSILFDLRGRVVPEAKRITIPESGQQTGDYKNEDLTLKYKMARGLGLLTISGEIRFTDRIAGNFPIIQYFHLEVMLVDAQGKILNTAGLASVAYYRTQYALGPDYPLAFNTSVTLPETTRSIAFNYTGKAYDPSEADGGSMDFWEYPVY